MGIDDFIAKSGHVTVATMFSVLVGVSVYGVLVVVLRMFSPDELEFIPGGSKLKKLMYRNRSKRAQ